MALLFIYIYFLNKWSKVVIKSQLAIPLSFLFLPAQNLVHLQILHEDKLLHHLSIHISGRICCALLMILF